MKTHLVDRSLWQTVEVLKARKKPSGSKKLGDFFGTFKKIKINFFYLCGISKQSKQSRLHL